MGHWFTDEPVMQGGSDVVVIAGQTMPSAGPGSTLSSGRDGDTHAALVANLRKFARCHVDVEVIAMVGVRFGAKRRAENPAGGCMCFMQKRSRLRFITCGVAWVHDD
jgi:hypothetical protein